MTGLINGLVRLATQAGDEGAVEFLRWFVEEQEEEEESASAALEKLKSVRDAPGGLAGVDGELGKRVFQPPR